MSNLFFSNGFFPLGIECSGLWVEKTVREIPFDISRFSNFKCWVEYIEKLIQWVLVIAQITTKFGHVLSRSNNLPQAKRVKSGQMKSTEVEKVKLWSNG